MSYLYGISLKSSNNYDKFIKEDFFKYIYLTDAIKIRQKKDFMNQILYLARTYSQGRIEYAKLKKVIENKDWTETPGRYYFFNYDGRPFEVYEIDEDPHIIIGFSYYR